MINIGRNVCAIIAVRLRIWTQYSRYGLTSASYTGAVVCLVSWAMLWCRPGCYWLSWPPGHTAGKFGFPSSRQPSSHSFWSLYCCMGLLWSKCSTWHLTLLNAIQLGTVRCSGLSGSHCRAFLPWSSFMFLPNLVSCTDLHSFSSSRSFIIILNKAGSILSPGDQHLRPTASQIYLHSCWPSSQFLPSKQYLCPSHEQPTLPGGCYGKHWQSLTEIWVSNIHSIFLVHWARQFIRDDQVSQEGSDLSFINLHCLNKRIKIFEESSEKGTRTAVEDQHNTLHSFWDRGRMQLIVRFVIFFDCHFQKKSMVKWNIWSMIHTSLSTVLKFCWCLDSDFIIVFLDVRYWYFLSQSKTG